MIIYYYAYICLLTILIMNLDSILCKNSRKNNLEKNGFMIFQKHKIDFIGI